MDMTPTYWEDNSAIQHVKFESCNAHDEVTRMKDERPVYTCCDTNLNFSTATCSEDDCEYGPYKKNKVARQDPMSHRIIEKRRRDRMNNCLADLSRLIPTEYLKKGRGRIEKTEIIEMAIKHMKYLQQEHGSPTEHYRLGYQECMSEVMRFMVEVEGHFPREAVCVRLLSHLQKHCESISRTSPYTQPRTSSQSQQQPTTEHIVPVPNVHEPPARNETPIMKMDYQVPKAELEQNNNNNNGSFVIRSTIDNNTPSITESDYEKQNTDMNGGGMMSYKYKTNIKLRFTQDINGTHHEEIMGTNGTSKRQKLECSRRNSCTSVENQSSSHSSPPSSELCTRISDSDINNRHSPSDSTLSITNSTNNNNLKLENGNANDVDIRYCGGAGSSPPPAIIKNLHHSTSRGDMKHNFNVPIFVLHAKGSYYVPVMIDYKTLLPFLQNYDILEVVPAAMRNIVLHPVTINVNFLPNINNEMTNNNSNNNNNSKYKNEFSNNWH